MSDGCCCEQDFVGTVEVVQGVFGHFLVTWSAMSTSVVSIGRPDNGVAWVWVVSVTTGWAVGMMGGLAILIVRCGGCCCAPGYC